MKFFAQLDFGYFCEIVNRFDEEMPKALTKKGWEMRVYIETIK